MAAVVVPPRAGVLSAVGLIPSPRQREFVRSWPTPGHHAGLDEALEKVAQEAGAAVGDDAEVTTALDCRYAGQSHELTVATVDDFPDEHRRRNGYARPGAPIEVVALRARAQRPAAIEDVARLGPPPQPRHKAKGPCVLAEPDCTVWVPEGWTADTSEGGSWILRRSRS